MQNKYHKGTLSYVVCGIIITSMIGCNMNEFNIEELNSRRIPVEKRIEEDDFLKERRDLYIKELEEENNNLTELLKEHYDYASPENPYDKESILYIKELEDINWRLKHLLEELKISNPVVSEFNIGIRL